MYNHEIWRRKVPAGYWVDIEKSQPDMAGPNALPPAYGSAGSLAATG
jgi:hypothetical protein